MDSETRYILASHLSKNRDPRAVTTVMRKAKAVSAEPPKTIKTDKWRAYNRPIANVFPDAKNVKSEGLTAELNNNQSERLQGTFRQRTKTLRGLDSKESGQTYLDGWTLDYNLFRKHHSLKNRTPAQAARASPPFDEWAEVVEHVAPYKRAKMEVVLIGDKRNNDKRNNDRLVVSVNQDSLKDLPHVEQGKPKARIPQAKVVSHASKAQVRAASKPHPYLRRSEARGRR